MLTFIKRLVFYGVIANLLWHTFFVEPPFRKSMRERGAQTKVVKPPKRARKAAVRPPAANAAIDFVPPLREGL